MAFWGATHSKRKTRRRIACGPRIDAQRAIRDLNERRTRRHCARTEKPRAPPPGFRPSHHCMRCSFGTGINTGLATGRTDGLGRAHFELHRFRARSEFASRRKVFPAAAASSSATRPYNIAARRPGAGLDLPRMLPSRSGHRDAVRIYEVPWQTPPAKMILCRRFFLVKSP